jgi:hypothetical protein
MGDTMAISRVELLKELLPNMNRLLKDAHEALKIDQIIHNDAQAAREKEFIKQAGKTFRDDVKVAQIIANEKRLKDTQNAIQEQSR